MASTDEAGLRRRVARQKPSVQATARARTLARAALYRMLALAFSPPGPELVQSVVSDCGGLNIALKQGALPLSYARSLAVAGRAWRAVTPDELASEYSRLFLGAGLVPLREGGFGDGFRFAGQPVEIADVSGFYLAFGFELPASAANPPDHLGAELEFMSLLHLKLVLARQRRKREQVRVTRSAMANFLKDHLGRWAESFNAALREAGAAPAYRTMGRLMAQTVIADCMSLDARPLKARAGSGEDPAGGEEFSCPFSDVGAPGQNAGAACRSWRGFLTEPPKCSGAFCGVINETCSSELR